jgi:hypothetical protein
VLTVHMDPHVNKDQVSHKEKQELNEGPLGGPDMRDFLWKCQEVIINLELESDTEKIS